MGQYYKAYIENDEGKIVLDSWDYGSGSKLMEHSWIGNNFLNAAYTEIDRNPSKVGWIGDYSDDVGVDMDIYRYAWSTDKNNVRIKIKRSYENGYLFNHTKGEYIHLSEYKKLANDGGWIINPLSLLTAIGNGLGGGDYHGNNPNYNLVGYWYLDEIEYSSRFLSYCKDYANVSSELVFKECW